MQRPTQATPKAHMSTVHLPLFAEKAPKYKQSQAI